MASSLFDRSSILPLEPATTYASDAAASVTFDERNATLWAASNLVFSLKHTVFRVFRARLLWVVHSDTSDADFPFAAVGDHCWVQNVASKLQ